MTVSYYTCHLHSPHETSRKVESIVKVLYSNYVSSLKSYLIKAALLFLLFSIIHISPSQVFASANNGTYNTQLGPYGSNVEMGASVSSGDFNNDGIDDLAVGSPSDNSNTGTVYIYYGTSSGFPSDPDTTITGEATGNSFGNAISGTGDANNDGYNDLIVGAWRNNASAGKAYLYLGSSSGIQASPSQSVVGEGNGNRLGYSVSFAGDANNDGYDDIIVGAYAYGTNLGRVYVYMGNSSGMATTPNRTLSGEAINNAFGYAINSAGDTNNDGYDDIVIGAYQYSSSTGRTYIYNGSGSGISASPSQTLTGQTVSSEFGGAVAGVGDTNNDGYDDIVVGAQFDNSSDGLAYVFLGSASGIESSPNSTLSSGNSDNYFGSSVSGAGDINNDGYDDILVGQENYFDVQSYTGRAFLYYGGDSGVSNTIAITYASPNTGAEFAGYRTPLTHGDFQGLGVQGLAIGAPGYPNQDYEGTVYIYYGDAPIPTPTPTSAPSTSSDPTTTPTPEPIQQNLVVESSSGGIISAVDGTATLIVPSSEQPSNEPTYFWFIPRTNADIQAGNSITGQPATIPPSIINNSITQIFQLDPSNLTTGEHIAILPEPIIISIPVTKQVSPSRARLYFYNTTTRRWQTVNVPLVFNLQNQTVAFTTKNAGLYIVSTTIPSIPSPTKTQSVQGASINTKSLPVQKKNGDAQVIQKTTIEKPPKTISACGLICSASQILKNISPFH